MKKFILFLFRKERVIWGVMILFSIYFLWGMENNQLHKIINNEFISLIGNITSILLGFVATTISVFFSVSNKNVFRRIKQRNVTQKFIWRYGSFFSLGIIVLSFSLLLITNCITQWWVYTTYCVLIEALLCYFFRLQRLTLELLCVIINEDDSGIGKSYTKLDK